MRLGPDQGKIKNQSANIDPPTYYIDFNNRTDRVWNMGVYLTLPAPGGQENVIWRRTIAPPGGVTGVEWKVSYDVALSDYLQVGALGVYKSYQLTENIEPGTKWKVVFEENVQRLKPLGATSAGYIYIKNESGRLANPGIGMSGQPAVYRRDVLSGLGVNFRIEPTYYVFLFDELSEGKVLTSSMLSNSLEVSFPENMNKAILTATIDGETLKLDLEYSSGGGLSHSSFPELTLK